MVTDQQVRRLRMLVNKERTQAIAAAKSGMSEKTAGKYLKNSQLPGERIRPRTWRTRKSPFEEHWPEITGYLMTNPGLEAKTIFEDLQRRYPGNWPDGQLRTLQRRIRVYRATDGPAKEVFFPQIHKPGELGEFDFTNMNNIGITILKESFKHLVGHFVLTYSNWEHGEICYSESFESLSEGIQCSLWELGGVPYSMRSDNLSAAVHKDCNPEVFTERYKQLLKHYGLTGNKIQPGRANENGDIEQRHNRFKKALTQALMLRGSSDFESVTKYRLFLKKLFVQLNAGRRGRLKEELNILRPLPYRKMDIHKTFEFTVGQNSTIHILHNTYSVNSRLIGEKIKALVYSDHIEIWYAQRKVDTLPRIRGEKKQRINYRHIIEWLVRKPGAFNNYKYREELYPSSHFRIAYDSLRERVGNNAGREYLKILHLAFVEGEAQVEKAIQDIIGAGVAISLESVEALVRKMGNGIITPEVAVEDVDLSEYDALLCSTFEEVGINA
jgi:transposase